MGVTVLLYLVSLGICGLPSTHKRTGRQKRHLSSQMTYTRTCTVMILYWPDLSFMAQHHSEGKEKCHSGSAPEEQKGQ